MKKIAFISGASSGIGEAVARRLAKDGYNLIIAARRSDRLENLAQELASQGCETKTLCFDIRDNAAVKAAVASLDAKWQEIDVLINNAGLAVGLEPIAEGNIDDWERMIDTNVKGLLYLSRAIAPLMVQRKSGHIVNIGSIAGKEVYPNGNVYCASKHAVDAISKAMRQDLLKHGIKVSQICPGAVETEFSIVRFKGDEERAKNVYKGFEPLRGEDIADVISYCLSLPKHVNINDLVLMPSAQANATLFNR